MQKSKDTAESADAFLANTLHEIRTPIQTIIGTLELLSDTQLDKEQTEYVRQIQFSSDVLLALANEVLDFSKIHSKEFKLENIPYDITFVTERTVDLITIEAFNKGLEIVTDIDSAIPSLVMGDPTRIQQILLNLIKNAVKFTQKGFIRISLTSRNGSMLFQVADSGIGIAPESRNKLFTTFYQADRSTTRKYGGTGLGLSICKNLITAMKGKIGIKQNRPTGSVFWFSVPLIPAITELRLLQETKLIPPQGTKVLLVDDSPLALKSFSKKLHAFGIEDIHTTSTGKQALTLLERAEKEGKPFTEAFIDMIMPVMDGWRLAADINAKTEINNIKLYLVVPEGQMGGEAKMKLLNWYNGYLYKPVKHEKLKEILLNAFTEPMELESADNEEEAAPLLSVPPKNFNPEDLHVAEGLHILVAEDHPINRKLLVTFLEKFGTHPLEACDGNETILAIRKHPDTDIIFMDIQMPVKNGIEAAIELRSSKYGGIIIACTANNDVTDLAEYYKNGINDILIKPFKSKNIRAVIEKWRAVLTLPSSQEIARLSSMQQNQENQTTGLWSEKDFTDTIGGNIKLGCQLLNDFVSQADSLLRKAEKALSDRDFQALRQTGHTLQGSSAAISIQLLAGIAYRMDAAAKDENLEETERCYNEFKKQYIQFKYLVGQWRNRYGENSQN
jgi:CheY-like chemotaxis protein/HPt (histidine-containing phosphotransfer) domain-containing protein